MYKKILVHLLSLILLLFLFSYGVTYLSANEFNNDQQDLRSTSIGLDVITNTLVTETKGLTVPHLVEANEKMPMSRFTEGDPADDIAALKAVGMLNGGSCTATLIDQDMVLTAAHCVCRTGSDGEHTCNERATFTLVRVFPIDDPNTPIDESLTEQNISFQGNVRVHPEYEAAGWLREDFAVVDLDEPANSRVENVTPIPVEQPNIVPTIGQTMTLVGFGRTGANCSQGSTGKMKLELPVSFVSSAALRFKRIGVHACPGDSGGPAINANGNVVGVTSWINFYDESTYRPTHPNHDFIFNLSDPNRQYDLAWSAIDSGGGETNGGEFSLFGRVGQPIAGPTSDDIYALFNGLWPSGLDMNTTSVAVIDPTVGGVFFHQTSTALQVWLSVPAEAIDTPLEVNIRNGADTSVTNDLPIVGELFSITAYKVTDTTQPVTQFDQPLTMTLSYAGDPLNDIDEAQLSLFYWDTTVPDWVIVPSVVNQDANQVMATLEHLTTFALMSKVNSASTTIYLPMIQKSLN